MSENKYVPRADLKDTSFKEKGNFMSGVVALTVSTAIVKLIGVLYKIPMLRLLGDEGMGYFNSAYEIYSVFYILATAGLPVAVSILVAERNNKKQTNSYEITRVFRVALSIFTALGVIGTLALFFGARYFAQAIENSGAFLCISAISPMAIFICLSSAARGYFQGKQNMIPTAVSQIIEATGKLTLGLLPAMWAAQNGKSVAEIAAYATLGIALGEGVSCTYLFLTKLIKDRKTFCVDLERDKTDIKRVSGGSVALRLVKISVPITVSSMVLSLTRVIDLLMIMRRLQAIGYTEAAANAIYGSYTTLALSMFNLPASFITPIALSLVPAVTSALRSANKERERNTLNTALKLCGFITIPASLGLSVFSRPILELVFYGEDQAISTAAPLLSVLGLSVFFSCVITVTSSILQAYGEERKPIASMLIGSLIKVVLSYILIGMPSVNVYGAPISTLACTFSVALINMAFVKRRAPYVEGVSSLFLRTLCVSAISVGAGGAICFSLSQTAVAGRISTLVSIITTVLLFVVLALRFKAIERDDILSVPGGKRLYKILNKTKLIK